jgi:pyruvate ferredoxin oxidoreductase gamma subunit
MWDFFRKRITQHRLAVEIRMEAIGGQGANSAGKILAEAAVLKLGYTGQHFSSFGSEKRGSPVKSFVRFYTDKRPVRSSSPILYPDVLVVFHESLIAHNPDILDGSTEKTLLLINSNLPPHEIVLPSDVKAGRVATVNASEISAEKKSGLNAPLLGAISHLIPELEVSSVEESLLKFFGKLDDAKKAALLQGFKVGERIVKTKSFRSSQARGQRPQKSLPTMGWANAPIGGVIVNPGNTVLRDNSASRRGQVPKLDLDTCIHCGLCDMVCPDYCFVWDTSSEKQVTRLLGLDYRFCKGCEKCVTVCPMQALTVDQDSDSVTKMGQADKFNSSIKKGE